MSIKGEELKFQQEVDSYIMLENGSNRFYKQALIGIHQNIMIILYVQLLLDFNSLEKLFCVVKDCFELDLIEKIFVKKNSKKAIQSQKVVNVTKDFIQFDKKQLALNNPVKNYLGQNVNILSISNQNPLIEFYCHVLAQSEDCNFVITQQIPKTGYSSDQMNFCIG